jgi:hypothetical protein
MRLRRLPLMMAELWRSLAVMLLMMDSMRVNCDSSTLEAACCMPAKGPTEGSILRMDCMLPSFFVGMPKYPISPESRTGESQYQDLRTPSSRKRGQNQKTGKCSIIPRFEQPLKGTFILQEDEWRRMQSVANSSPREIPWYQGNLQGISGYISRARSRRTWPTTGVLGRKEEIVGREF